jgi:hypothetical protein
MSEIVVTIIAMWGKNWKIKANTNETIKELKSKIARELTVLPHKHVLRSPRKVEYMDEYRLGQYGIKDDCCMCIMFTYDAFGVQNTESMCRCKSAP